MRIARIGRSAAVLAAVTAVFVVTVASAAAGSTSVAARTITHTSRIVVRPVSWTARVTPGYTVSTEHPGSIDCTAPSPSPGAVDPDILMCSPSAEYAVACWLSRTPHRSLCLRDPRVDHLVSISRTGVMAQALPYQVRGPLGLLLGDGSYCEIRIGGAGSALQGHPDDTATYYCQHNQSVWAPINARDWGVNRSHPVWTVRTAPSDGHGALRTRSVAKAWFVGMHS